MGPHTYTCLLWDTSCLDVGSEFPCFYPVNLMFKGMRPPCNQAIVVLSDDIMVARWCTTCPGAGFDLNRSQPENKEILTWPIVKIGQAGLRKGQ